MRDGVRDRIKRNGRAGITARNVTAGDRFKRPNVGNATSVQRTGVSMVAAFKHNDRRGVPSIASVRDRVTNAADGLGKTARGVGVRNVAGALRRFQRRAVSGFGAHNVRNQRERHNVRVRDAGGVRGAGRRDERRHGKR